jgi:arsenite oxidase small subunit
VSGGPKKELETGKDEGRDAGRGRRTFLKATVVASAALAVGGAAALAKTLSTPGEAQASATTATGFPSVQVQDISTGLLATVSNLVTNVPLSFYYPLDNEPNIIVKLGVAVEDGVGPDGDIVAFSDVCQHLGCAPGFVAQGQSPKVDPSYTAPVPVMYCPCHGSIYDLTNDAKVVGGPAQFPVPRVILSVDGSGNIFATGMGPPTIYQHGPAGSDDVTYDLQGGTPVS